MIAISRYAFYIVVMGFLLATVVSCGLLKSSGAEYQKSTNDIPLQVPKGLAEPNRDAALIVPK